MHQTRNEVSSKIPIPRKGSKYVARAKGSLKNSVPVVIAVRDMLSLARTTKEVKEMIFNKNLKLNGREVKDYRESVSLFNLLEAGKTYSLTFSPSGKFALEEAKNSKERPCKVIGKKIMKGNKTQLNLHDGSNVLTDKKVEVGDTLYLDLSGKITKHVALEKGKSGIVTSGKYLGRHGKIESIKDGKISFAFDDSTSILDKGVVFVL